MRKFLVFIALFGLLALFGPASPVEAAVGAFTDPNTDGAVAQGDITDMVITHQTTVTLRILVQTPSDPATDDNWKDSPDTFISWLIDTTGDGAEEFEAVFFAETDGTVVGELATAVGDPVCETSVEARYFSNGYEVSFPRSCLGDPATIRFNALMSYDTTPLVDDTPQTDSAPDGEAFTTATAGPTGPVADRAVRVGVIGATDNQVWAGHGGGPFYEALGGQAIAAPAVARIAAADPAQNGIPVYVVTGSDNQLWIRTPSVPWRLLSDARTHCIGTPAAIVYDQVGGGGQQITVGCRGSDNGLWKSSGPITTSTLPKLNSWTPGGGILTAGPAVGISQQDGKKVTFLVPGVGGKIYQQIGSGFSPTPWTCKDHVAFGSLNDFSWFGCRGTDDGLWAAKNTPSGWQNAFPLGGRLTAGPGVAVTGSAAVFFVQGTDSAVWQTIVQNGDNARTPFTSNGGKIKFGANASSL